MTRLYREITVPKLTDPYQGEISEGASISLVSGLPELKREVLRIFEVTPIRGHDHLPIDHQALVVVAGGGKAGAGAYACHVGALEMMQELRLWILTDTVDLDNSPLVFSLKEADGKSHLFFPDVICRCHFCGLPLMGQRPHWAFSHDDTETRLCERCHELLVQKTEDWKDRHWAFHRIGK